MSKQAKLKQNALPLDAALACLLAIATLTVFGQLVTHDFINFDDPIYITTNQEVLRGLSASSVAWAFKGPHGGNWHPVTTLSHMLDVQLFGMKPSGHHAVSLAFHIANCLLLYFWLRRYAGGPWPSFIVAALFALHPQHVESVAWVSSRKDVLSTFFWLLTMFAYARYVANPSTRRYVFVCIWLALGLMSKPMLVTVPITLLLLDFWPLKRISFGSDTSHGKQFATFRMLLIEKIPLFALCVLQGLATLWAQSAAGAMVSSEKAPLAIRLANAVYAYWMYVVKMLWPTDLLPFYPYRGFAAASAVGILALLGLVGLSVVALRARNKYPYITFGWLWFVITLLPVIGIIQVGSQGMADRYTYVPFIGLFIAMVWLLNDIALSKAFMRKVQTPIAAIVLAACAVLAFRQAGLWKNSLTLWQYAYTIEPTSGRVLMSLGGALKDDKKFDDAIAVLTKAAELEPMLPGVHNRLGLTLLQKGDPAGAAIQFEKELALARDDVMTLTNLGNAYFEMRKPDQAALYYGNAVAVDPLFEDAHNGLGMVAMVQRKPEAAIKHFERCIRLAPRKFEAMTNLAAALLQIGERAIAIQWCQKALAINPEYPRARALLKELQAQ
jgi:tetratricopeptide (TPR) repeat protein